MVNAAYIFWKIKALRIEAKKGHRVKKKILMITLSNHTSFQDGVFSMYENLKGRYEVSTLTIAGSSYPVSQDKNNYFFHSTCPPVLLPPLLRRPYQSLYISDHREAVPYFY